MTKYICLSCGKETTTPVTMDTPSGSVATKCPDCGGMVCKIARRA